MTKVIDTITRGLPWGLLEVTGTVQVHYSRRRLVGRELEFPVYTINKSAHTKKSGNLSYAPRNLLKIQYQENYPHFHIINRLHIAEFSTCLEFIPIQEN